MTQKGWEEKKEMPKIKSTLTTGQEPTEGRIYKITSVEEVKTAVQGYAAYRVGLEPEKRKTDDTNKYATMLWSREVAGARSKLGAFMAAFIDFTGDEDAASDTDNWLNHTVRFIKWQPRDRQIQVLA